MSLLLKVRVMEMSLVIVRFAVGKSCTVEDEFKFWVREMSLAPA